MAAEFSRLFDQWDDDHDIALADISNDALSPERESVRSVDQLTIGHSLPPYDDTSTRSLLSKNDTTETIATAADFSPLEDGGDGTQMRARSRWRLGNNVRGLLDKTANLTTRSRSTFDGHFAHGKPGWWKKQMLVDRSLRSMAAFTGVCAVIMLIILLSYLPDFARRLNVHSTSVGGRDGESCSTAESRNVAVHLFINIAATMILGCSNTYRAINHKMSGRTKAWLCWFLLISTSMPVHFLANSVIGPSFYVQMPSNITYTTMDSSALPDSSWTSGGVGSTSSWDSGCWTAFRSDDYVLPSQVSSMDQAFNVNNLGNSTTFKDVLVQYGPECAAWRDQTDHETALEEIRFNSTYGISYYRLDNCTLGIDVTCTLSDPQEKQCRMNVRMQAAFILAGCLFIKAIYMIIHNYRARNSTKKSCLTFGDVIVASVLDPDLKIYNECMLNSGDGYRHEVQHTCHKHCKDPVPSTHGDGIGHCQKCKKFNDINRAADLAHPSIAIKYKRSLLSNLGSTAITQILLLMLTSLAMLGISIALIVSMTVEAQTFHTTCSPPVYPNNEAFCDAGLGAVLKANYGTWGGFSSSATLAPLPPDRLSSELLAFAISNGAQFLYSLLYLLLIYNLSLVSMEHEWGQYETRRSRPRCTIVSGRPFEQSYFLQLPPRLIIPLMAFAALMHWLLGQAISTIETIYTDPANGVEHSVYFVTYAAYPIFISTVLMVAMTVVCWWAFTYTREGFMPQFYGSIRACCASTTELTHFVPEGVQWGDLGMGEKFRHAGFSSDDPQPIVPAELYC